MTPLDREMSPSSREPWAMLVAGDAAVDTGRDPYFAPQPPDLVTLLLFPIQPSPALLVEAFFIGAKGICH